MTPQTLSFSIWTTKYLLEGKCSCNIICINYLNNIFYIKTCLLFLYWNICCYSRNRYLNITILKTEHILHSISLQISFWTDFGYFLKMNFLKPDTLCRIKYVSWHGIDNSLIDDKNSCHFSPFIGDLCFIFNY